MLLTLLGALSVAILGACVAFVIRRMTGINARWLIPVSAGAGMLGFTLWNDYTWFERNASSLPPSIVITDVFVNRNAMQPWSMVVAPVNRFRAVDLSTVQQHPQIGSVRRAAVFMVARFNPTFVTRQLFDCAAQRRADIDGSALDEQGLPAPSAWLPVEPDAPLLRAVCDARIAA